MKSKTEISAFDLDHTLVEGNSSSNFCKYLCKKGVISKWVLLTSGIYSVRHNFLGMGLKELHHSVFKKLLKGRPFESLEKHLDAFVKEYLDKSLYMPAFARLKKAQQLGHYTMILSNSPSFLVQRIAKALGVDEFHASEYDLDEKNCFEKVRRVLEGKDKAKLIQTMAKKFGIFLDKVNAYSDSIHDLDFLQGAGNPTAVNPDRSLRQVSEENQWSII